MAIRVYNYPWSGRLGSIAKHCIHCGCSKNKPEMRLSSFGSRCLNCSHDDPTIPEFVEELEQEYLRLAKEWCDKRNIDYEATVQNYLENLGEMDQDIDSLPPNSDKDFTVYKG